MHVRYSVTLLFAALAAMVSSACAVNPATGQRQFSLISEAREIEMGRGADGEISAGFGVYEDPALATWITEMGMKLASASERPDLPWSFKVLDDPTVNAFALPGGFVYVTRGILAHLNSEAELAGVLGHEIGHVTARHSVSQMSRQQLQQGVLGVGMAVSEDIRSVGGVLQGGLGFLNLSYGRGDESQSDELGVRYMTRAGYDARELTDVFRTLALVSGTNQDRLPEWQSTHPNPENRERRIGELILASGVDYEGTIEGVSEFLRRIDGLTFGSNPRDGFFAGSLFRHPDLRFRLRFPEGWSLANERTRVGASNSERDAVLVLSVEEGRLSALEAANRFAEPDEVHANTAVRATINGLTAARMDFTSESTDGSYAGHIAFIELNGQTYRLMGLGTPAGWAASSRAITTAISSFAEETDAAVLGVEAWRIELVRLPRSTTGAGFMEGWPSVAPSEDVYRINRISANERLPAGRLLKRLVGRRLPG